MKSFSFSHPKHTFLLSPLRLTRSQISKQNKLHCLCTLAPLFILLCPSIFNIGLNCVGTDDIVATDSACLDGVDVWLVVVDMDIIDCLLESWPAVAPLCCSLLTLPSCSARDTREKERNENNDEENELFVLTFF